MEIFIRSITDSIRAGSDGPEAGHAWAGWKNRGDSASPGVRHGIRLSVSEKRVVGWRLKSGLQEWIGWVDICRYVVRGCVGRHRERVGPVRFALRSAVVSDGRMPSSVLPPARDARRRMFDPAAVGATLGACSVQLGCFAAVRRVRRQAVSRAGARKVQGAKRHAGSPSTPAVSACSTAVRSGRSDPCSRIGNRWRLHAGRTDAQGTVQRAGRLHLVDGGRGEPEEPLQRGRSVKVVRDASVGDSRVSVWVERVGMRCGKHPPQRPPENG